MQVASILSDLASLRVCDHSAALTLVSVYEHEHERASSTTAGEEHGGELSVNVKAAEEDQDMRRAMDLVELHYGVKMKHVQGEDAALRQARRQVDAVLEKFENHKS